METVDIFYSHLEYFAAIWYTLWSFGNVVIIWYFFTVFVYRVKKNLATLVARQNPDRV
jgi:hypothetical protein